MSDYICLPQECTLCMACRNICPVGAIEISMDENGYEKITISAGKCINCGQCRKVCHRRKDISGITTVLAYAAQAKSKAALMKSASGGAFQMLAQLVLKKGGVCYGCTFEKTDGKYIARHISIQEEAQLPRILNSKYIPSIIGSAFQEAKCDLDEGRLVLFSGTPCQIQGLRAFLNKDYNNLLTADLICHGVTAGKLFNDYIRCEEQNQGIKITDYSFRDKSVSWGTNYSYIYYRENDNQKRIQEKHCPREASSYMVHYLYGNIFRENCYRCSLSNTERVSDFTLGDYWEIEREHPEYITRCTPRMSLRRGISCILVNTEKAKQYIPLLKETMILHEVSLKSVSDHNGNLRSASRKGSQREWFLETYRNEGYAVIDEAYRQSVGKKMKIYYLKNFLKSYLSDRIRILIYRWPLLSRIVFHQ